MSARKRPRLEWYPNTDATLDGRFAIQREHGLHEPPFYTLECSEADMATADRIGAPTEGFGNKRATMKRTAQRIADEDPFDG